MSTWHKLKKRDLKHLEGHAKNYPPYCHLNIIDLWAYKVTNNYWFEVGDTIAYKLNDYNDDSLYTTLLGHRSAKHAIKLICQSQPDAKKLTLRCLPESVLVNLNGWAALSKAEEDADNHDYVFDVLDLMTMRTAPLQRHAKKFRRLLKQHPKLHHKALNPKKFSDRRQIYGVFKLWVKQTNADEWKKEFRALKRALKLKNSGLVCLGFYDSDTLVGFTVNRPEPDDYYQAYFGKADRNYNMLSLYQEVSTAAYMHEHFGCLYMNLQPDSGITGLRNYKQSLGPSRHLKKYTVEIDAELARSLA